MGVEVQQNEGRPRSASGLSLRPALGTLSRMRSRSLLKPECMANGDIDLADQTTSVAEQHEGSSAGLSTVIEQHQQGGSQQLPSSTSSSFGFETDTTDSESAGPQTPTEQSDLPPPAPVYKLPYLPRRGTFSSLLKNAANPFSGAASTSTPRLNRAQSYLALSIPPTPGPSTLELRGDDEDRRLPSPVSSEVYKKRDSHDGDRSQSLAARPLHSSFYPPSSTSASPHSLSSIHASRHQSLSKLLPPVLFLLGLFCISLTCIYFAISTIPLTLPHNVSEIRLQSIALRDYSRKGLTEGLHVSAVLSAIFVFKQAFSVPGSILVNILFGSLYGTYAATLCACIFTGVGSVFAYYMAKLCAPLVERFFPRALASTRSTLMSGSNADLFSYLLLARLFPLLPYSLLNIACGVLKIPVGPYFITLVLGSFPYNFVTTQLGDLLGSLASTVGEGGSASSINAIWTWDLCFKLAVASVLSAAPLLFKEQLKTYLGGSSSVKKLGSDDLDQYDTSSSALGLNVDMEELNGAEAEKMAVEQNIPLLRRDRTDSTASEVLAGPVIRQSRKQGSGQGKGHGKQWSFSWGDWRHSAQNESSSSSGSSGDTYNTSSATTVDEESGDTDEEDLRERRASDSRRSSRSYEPPAAGAKSQRRTASIETSSHPAYSPNSGSASYFFDHPRSASSTSEWDRF